jgi:integrase
VQRNVAVITKTFTKGTVTPQRSTKTEAGRREVKLLAPALEALKAQKTHTLLKDAEVFQNPKTLERWNGDQAHTARYVGGSTSKG